MTEFNKKLTHLLKSFPDVTQISALGETTLVCKPQDAVTLLKALKQEPGLDMGMLADLCGIDYLHYGQSEWETSSATATGYGRGIERFVNKDTKSNARFAIVYHLLSMQQKERLRVRVALDTQRLQIDSIVNIWPNAQWYEREVYDLYGIHFTGHPDLRRILTDYGFIGHPFRKDFPLEGYVEMRYDANLERCVYEPCEITPRVSVPKVIRKEDNRYYSQPKEDK